MHLIIIQNGLNGFSFAMKYVLNYYQKHLDKNNYKIVVSNVNDFINTHDGLENMGIRLSKFVIDQTDNKTKKISFVGHSLGGLMIRSCIKILFEKNYFDNVIPCGLISITTPHMGIFEIDNVRKFCANWFLGKTGQELLLQDKENILYEMTGPKYLNVMNLFKHKVVYANIKGDTSVSYKTASITTTEFEKFNDIPTKHKLYIVIEPNNFVNPDIPSSVQKIHENLNSIQWIKKAIDLSDSFFVHVYILGRGLTSNNIVLEDTLQFL